MQQKAPESLPFSANAGGLPANAGWCKAGGD
jgi:hypothetical protein